MVYKEVAEMTESGKEFHNAAVDKKKENSLSGELL